MSHTFEQFVRFTTDAAGLERTLRLFHAISQILSSYTLPFNILLLLLAYLPTSASPTGSPGKGPNPATTHAALLGLKSQLALARRYFRLFRFLESFHAAQKLYSSLSSQSTGKDKDKGKGERKGERENLALWLDVFSRTFNGMYLLLEASTIADAQGIPGLALWGPDRERAVTVEGQRFWLFSLACGALAGLVRIADVVALASAEPVSVSASGANGGGGGDGKEEDGTTTDEKTGDGDGTAEKVSSPQEQIDHHLARSREEVRAKISGLGRRVVSDALDITLPGSVVGWVPVGTGTVGLAMFVTTVLTSVDIWDRCGREVAAGGK